MTVSFNTPSVDHQTAVVGIVLVVAALAASILVEVYRRHYSKKNLESLGKAWTTVLLAGISAAFTGLGYILIVAQANASYLTALPFVGKHVWGVIGVATVLYNLRLNKSYQTAATFLNKWVGKKATEPNLPQPAASPEPGDALA